MTLACHVARMNVVIWEVFKLPRPTKITMSGGPGDVSSLVLNYGAASLADVCTTALNTSLQAVRFRLSETRH